MPSFEPMSASTSVAGSSATPKRASNQRAAAWRNAGNPLPSGYWW